MDPFIGMIVAFGGNFAPRGWALCNGQLLAISEHTSLFSILGTTYGGNGHTTFALPDLRGRSIVHPGAGPGLSHQQLGTMGGAESITLYPHQLPPHTHSATLQLGEGAGTSTQGNGQYLAMQAEGKSPYTSNAPTGGSALGDASISVGSVGNGQPISFRPPYQVINYIIALDGVHPSRS